MDKQDVLLLAAGGCLVLPLWYLLEWIWRTKLGKWTRTLVSKLFQSIGYILGTSAGKYQEYIEVMNAYRREKNLIYKYHFMMNVSIESLGLRTKSNVQSVLFYILIVSGMVTSILTVGISIWISMFLFLTLVVFFHLLLVFLARSRTTKRYLALMDAEDILCTSMEDGIQVSIDRNIKAIDPAVRYMFEELQTDIALKIPMGTALANLNTKAGKQLDSFCQTALVHYRDNDPVSLLAFKDNIQRNAKRRIAISTQQENYSTCMKYYMACMIAIVFFSLGMSSMLGLGVKYFFTVYGRAMTIISVCLGLFGFVASQIIFSGEVQ